MEPVSVIVPTYNRADLLRLALHSVAKATGPDDEVIVVDDGSTDHTEAVVLAGDAPWRRQVRYLRLPNGGAGRARNAGVRAAAFDLIAFADSDDEWLPWRLQVQRPVMESERSTGFCFSDFGQIHEDGRVESGWLVQWSQDLRSWTEILGPARSYKDRWPVPTALATKQDTLQWHAGSMYLQELGSNYINVNTVLARRSVLGDALQFGEDLPTYEDWECFARITRVAPCIYLDFDTALQRAHPGPRLTGTAILTRLQTRIGIIERTWARDEVFARDHADELTSTLSGLRRSELRQLVVTGHRQEGKAHLRRHGGPWKDRLALALPDALVRRLVPQRA